jgi:hypothetical protein
MGLKLKFRPRNGVKMALRSRPQAKPAAGAHQRFLSPLPLPRRKLLEAACRTPLDGLFVSGSHQVPCPRAVRDSESPTEAEAPTRRAWQWAAARRLWAQPGPAAAAAGPESLPLSTSHC